MQYRLLFDMRHLLIASFAMIISVNPVWGQTTVEEYYPVGTVVEEVNCRMQPDNDFETNEIIYFRLRSLVKSDTIVDEKRYKKVEMTCIDGNLGFQSNMLESFLIRESGDSLYMRTLNGKEDFPQYDFNWETGKRILYNCYGGLTAPVEEIQTIILKDDQTYECINTERAEIGLFIRGIGKQYYGTLRCDTPSRNGQRRVLVKFERGGQVIYQRDDEITLGIDAPVRQTKYQSTWNIGGRQQSGNLGNGRSLSITRDGRKSFGGKSK